MEHFIVLILMKKLRELHEYYRYKTKQGEIFMYPFKPIQTNR